LEGRTEKPGPPSCTYRTGDARLTEDKERFTRVANTKPPSFLALKGKGRPCRSPETDGTILDAEKARKKNDQKEE